MSATDDILTEGKLRSVVTYYLLGAQLGVSPATFSGFSQLY